MSVDAVSRFDGQSYVNKSLGFSVTLPVGWQAQDSDVQRQIAARASESARGIANERNRREMDNSIDRSRILLTAVKPTETSFNLVALVMSEDIRIALHVRTPRQYAEQMRRLSAAPALPIVFEGETMTERIADAEFAVMEARPRDPASVPTPDVRQKYFVTLRKNHALIFILSYSSPEQLRECRALLDTLRFSGSG